MRVQIAHTSVALNKANTSADSASSTTPLTRTTQLKRGKARRGTPDNAKLTPVELWRLEKRDLRIKACEAEEIQLEVRVGAKHECLLKWVSRLKHDRDEEVLRDCFFPQYHTNHGVSPLRRRTARAVRRDSCGKVIIVVTEADDICVLGAIVDRSTTGSANQFASHV